MIYDRTDRIRRAAILVASMEEELGERLLAELSPLEAKRVLIEVGRLTDVDAEEQQDVLAEFRHSKERRRGDAGVEIALASHDVPGAAAATSAPGLNAAEASTTLSDSDVDAMAEMLADEHPQIVAAALSRLGDDQRAAVFAALPASLQSEALARLATLAPADEGAVHDVETELLERLQQRRERQARCAAGVQMVQNILARTPTAQRAVLIERLASANLVAGHGGLEDSGVAPATANRAPIAQQAKNLASAVQRAKAGNFDSVAAPADSWRRAGTAGASRRIDPSLDDLSAELERLDDATLISALRRADETTVLRALAASGDEFLNRVSRMLPRREAKKLRRMLQQLGPTKLADLQKAQYELVRAALDVAPPAGQWLADSA